MIFSLCLFLILAIPDIELLELKINSNKSDFFEEGFFGTIEGISRSYVKISYESRLLSFLLNFGIHLFRGMHVDIFMGIVVTPVVIVRIQWTLPLKHQGSHRNYKDPYRYHKRSLRNPVETFKKLILYLKISPEISTELKIDGISKVLPRVPKIQTIICRNPTKIS